MRVKNQYNLQPTEFESHAVVLEDSEGNIIFAAVELEDGTILAAQAGDKDFEPLLKYMQIDKVTAVTEIKPKSVQEMSRLLN
jgi:hypothetical protein